MIPSVGALKIGSLLKIGSGVSSLGVPGVPWHPQVLADQLTLSHPPINTGTLGFSVLPTTLRIHQLFGPKTEREAKILSGIGNIADSTYSLEINMIFSIIFSQRNSIMYIFVEENHQNISIEQCDSEDQI